MLEFVCQYTGSDLGSTPPVPTGYSTFLCKNLLGTYYATLFPGSFI